MTREEAATAVEVFLTAYQVAEDRSETTVQLLQLVRAAPMGGKQVHDANVVATMLASGIKLLLTFNEVDLHRFGARVELIVP